MHVHALHLSEGRHLNAAAPVASGHLPRVGLHVAPTVVADPVAQGNVANLEVRVIGNEVADLTAQRLALRTARQAITQGVEEATAMPGWGTTRALLTTGTSLSGWPALPALPSIDQASLWRSQAGVGVVCPVAPVALRGFASPISSPPLRWHGDAAAAGTTSRRRGNRPCANTTASRGTAWG
eukprot:CAMPEP_0175794906 /NCGR_PEP_ID=MMETSP0097-20121207/84203_1 /TAXON_ID=311494 /ORGANISM="Alexandrium monilatum, Strain CCMP3105" /LENGTH=181 /DNA_ID=CAMNT_0017106099 /DNA_START=194 /DNA_END=740 /DNA_ORIENTATION=+